MRLVTCQAYSVYEKILRDGFHACNIKESPTADIYIGHYDYIVESLSEKVAKPAGVTHPIWAYYKPPKDYDYTQHGAEGELNVYFELEVPDEEVLLINPYNWDKVVFDGFVFDDEISLEEYDKLVEHYAANPEELEANWRKVFDVDDSLDEIQAVFWVLDQSYIQKTVVYTTHLPND